MSRLHLTRLPAAGRVQSPWKNGGGVTWQVASEPQGASFEFANFEFANFEFDWRISLARVGSDGPFSSFPGVDRILTVLEGAMRSERGRPGAHRSGPDRGALQLSRRRRLRCGSDKPVVDLNLMVRRGSFRAQVETLHVQAETSLALDSDTVILFVASGEVEIVAGDGGVENLSRHDALRIDAPLPSSIVFRSAVAARLQVLRLWKL